MLRTQEAGTLRADHVDQTVTLAGWVGRRRDHGGVAFLDLRDASGVAQVVVRDEVLDEGGAHDLRNEYCVQVTGRVRVRPDGNSNTELPTGEIEVVAENIEVLSASATLPFQIDERVTVGEEARLKYRYLDLRRPDAGGAIRLRSKDGSPAIAERRGPGSPLGLRNPRSHRRASRHPRSAAHRRESCRAVLALSARHRCGSDPQAQVGASQPAPTAARRPGPTHPRPWQPRRRGRTSDTTDASTRAQILVGARRAGGCLRATRRDGYQKVLATFAHAGSAPPSQCIEHMFA